LLAGQLCAIFHSSDDGMLYVFLESSAASKFCAIPEKNVASLGCSKHFRRALQLNQFCEIMEQCSLVYAAQFHSAG